MIPISKVDVRDAEPFVLDVLRSGSLAQGPVVERLERAFAEVVGVPHAVAVSNGTTALVAALQVLDLRPGDEVVTSPFTFAATLNAILEAGATARFADIREADFAVDPTAVEAVVGDRTAALMPVHLYGQTADMDPLTAIADRHGLRLVEDAAQAHGAAYGGRGAGAFGIGCFSFYATKNLTTGEGGMVTTADATVADRLRVLRNQGMRARYQYEMAGHNYRMTDLHAAVGLPQVARTAEIADRRRHNADRLTAGLADVPDLRLPRQLPGRSHVWHQYTVLLPEGTDRDRVVADLAAGGVGSGIYYPRTVFDHDCYRADPRVVSADVPVAESVARRCLSLPVHQHLTEAELDTVVARFRGVLGA
ncbi:DegT/DnrJ/EryC1/StrS family aminotransferase [Blastococcus xanthinilyticus]|uniref:dTDP-4-amino-4,6-dideoxygalactose transaminase n=1 Tax=Blastococcus xanthinilyticus TaxID=1564164 RepID=A0A5S5CNW2_9ACTN|nr:DegT/DnrJ/EryC1/StrS family aminotransferase [Blastococcus xanthinilyticus]TYP80680.1 dTDP-4-amino-4,6-dideoxygalactose transaminase [Blastococcus xanthinilyticus]